MNRTTGQTIILASKMMNVEAMAITSNSRWLVVGTTDGTLGVWGLVDGVQKYAVKAHDGQVSGLVADQNGLVFSCGDDGMIRMWNIDRGEAELSIRSDWKKIHHLCIREDCQRIGAVSDKGAVRIWNLPNGNLLFSLPDASVRARGVWNSDLLGNPINNLVLIERQDWVMTNNGETINLWNLVDGSLLAASTGASPFETIALSPDESTLLVGTVFGETHRLAIETGRMETLLM